MSPFSFVLELFLHLSVPAGVGHTHQPRAGETELQRTGACGDQEGTTQILLPTFATYLPIRHFKLFFLLLQTYLGTNLYFCILFALFFLFLRFFFLSRCLSGLSEHQSRVGCLLLHSVEQLFKGVSGTWKYWENPIQER